jgi:hypothetical protein
LGNIGRTVRQKTVKRLTSPRDDIREEDGSWSLGAEQDPVEMLRGSLLK